MRAADGPGFLRVRAPRENPLGDPEDEHGAYALGLTVAGTPYLLWDESAVSTFLAVQGVEEGAPP